jgi:glycosyltransferase involved in cell wall biosynthesis
MSLSNSKTPSIDILLATYNGEKYLVEQIESLFAQSYKNFRVIARDDGSSDGTLGVLQAYQQKYGESFLLIQDGLPTGSAKKNFARLTLLSDADYTMYCDQDDYWHPDKIAKTLNAMLKAENGSTSAPVLVHSDLRVVDVDRNVISPSFWAYQGLDPSGVSLNNLITQNYITGCTVMINRALRMKAQPFPEAMIMHDWWLGLVAALCGRLVVLGESLIDYRQHGANDTGAKNYSFSYVLGKASRIFTASRFSEFKQAIARYKLQAQALLESLGSEMPEAVHDQIEIFVNLDKQGVIARRHFVLKHGFVKQGLAKNIAYLLSL